MAKAPLEIKSLARAHTERAINVLQSVMTAKKAPASARVAAAQALLDRGWGKATQVIAGDKENPLDFLGGLGASIDAKLDRLVTGNTRKAEERSDQ